MTEAELAKHFIDYLNGYDLYFEAPPHQVDIVAISGKKRIAIEVKKSLNFKVIEQAFKNTHWFHLSYVAVPEPKYGSFAYNVCRHFGIGVLTFNELLHSHNNRYCIMERVKPVFNKIPYKVLGYCNYKPHMKESIAGSSGRDGKVVTAFKMTIWELESYVKRHPGCTIKQAIENIDHHYSSFTGAKSCIYQYLRNGVIDTVQLRDKGLYISDNFIAENRL